MMQDVWPVSVLIGFKVDDFLEELLSVLEAVPVSMVCGELSFPAVFLMHYKLDLELFLAKFHY